MSSSLPELRDPAAELAEQLVAELEAAGHVLLAGEWMSKATTAAAVKLSERRLRELRLDGTGPVHRRFGETIIYHVVDVARWMIEREAARLRRKSAEDPVEFRAARRYVSGSRS